MLLHSSVSLFRASSATMAASSTITLPAHSFFLMASSYACPAHIHLHRTVKLNALSTLSIMLFAPFFFRLVSHQPTGLRLFPPPHSLIFFQPRHSISQFPIWFSMGLLHPMSIFVFSVVAATPTSPLPPPTNSLPAPPCVSFLVTLLIIKATAVSTGLPTGSSFPDMLSLMSHHFPSQRTPLVPPPRTSSFWTILTHWWLPQCHHVLCL